MENITEVTDGDQSESVVEEVDVRITPSTQIS